MWKPFYRAFADVCSEKHIAFCDFMTLMAIIELRNMTHPNRVTFNTTYGESREALRTKAVFTFQS